jgi:hypothetical protein
LTQSEWEHINERYSDLNPISVWKEWVQWVEEGGATRRPQNRLRAFEGWLKKRQKERDLSP